MARPVHGWALVPLTLRITALNLRARLQYRVDFLLWTLHGMAYQVMGLTFVWVVLAQFQAIHGWSLADIVFMYSLRLLAHGLYLPVFYNVMQVSFTIREGNFDRVLLRPLNPLLQVLLQTFNANSAGDIAVAIALFVIAQHMLHMQWRFDTAAFLVLVVIGGALMEAAIQLACATLAFWVVASTSVALWADTLMNTFANYPINIFAGVVRYLFTFLLPIAFLAYFPAAVFLGKAGSVAFTPLLAYGAPAAGVVAFLLAYGFWSLGLRHYQSTGT